MKKNVKNAKSDWLLKLSRENEGTYQVQHISYWDKSEEEIMKIANSYRSRYYSIVRVYRLETIL